MRVLLLGGGHAHAVVLREFARRAPQLGITLVSPSTRQTYSGMLPGLVAGHYTRDECEIDLARLAKSAGADLVLDAAIGLDPVARHVSLAGGTRLDYDLLSINTGSLPNFSVAPGAERWAIPVKPLDVFLDGWEKIRAGASARSVRVAVVGAGAGGVEIAMAIGHSLREQSQVVLFSEKSMFPAGAARRIAAALRGAAVELRPATPVDAVEEGPVLVAAGKRERFDFVIWTAGAAPLPWFRAAGLAVDRAGFVLVEDTLQSVSHPGVFAAGDSATLRDSPHPKSGVYAIRHGAVLLRNLKQAAAGGPLQRYVPQKRALALLSTGEHRAIATYGDWSAEGDWLWRAKDWIDRRWMNSFGGVGPQING